MIRVLATNDDGIQAKGLKALVDSLKSVAELAVVAPATQASATAHSISLHKTIKVQKVAWKNHPLSFSVQSTPVDCVRLAVLKLLPWRPDFIISGINQGANYGSLIFYSGTVAAAIEGAILGIPSIAISLASFKYQNYSASSYFISKFLTNLIKKKSTSNAVYNINVPPVSKNKIHGIAVTHQGKFRYVDDMQPHAVLKNHFQYVINSPFSPMHEHKNSDVEMVRKNFISVTPLEINLTNFKLIRETQKKLSEIDF
jgi:5'-nucleotidase